MELAVVLKSEVEAIWKVCYFLVFYFILLTAIFLRKLLAWLESVMTGCSSGAIRKSIMLAWLPASVQTSSLHWWEVHCLRVWWEMCMIFVGQTYHKKYSEFRSMKRDFIRIQWRKYRDRKRRRQRERASHPSDQFGWKPQVREWTWRPNILETRGSSVPVEPLNFLESTHFNNTSHMFKTMVIKAMAPNNTMLPHNNALQVRRNSDTSSWIATNRKRCWELLSPVVICMHDNRFHLKEYLRPHKLFTLRANICNYDELHRLILKGAGLHWWTWSCFNEINCFELMKYRLPHPRAHSN